MVLIVYGGANYSDFLPPKSYIDANEYKTTKDLADYLNFLKENPREYIKYFWWRKYYRISNYNEYNVYCELCKKLHEPRIQKKSRFYENIYEWWRGTACFESRIKIEEQP
jgi:alpha-1,3-fucosyltransferase